MAYVVERFRVELMAIARRSSHLGSGGGLVGREPHRHLRPGPGQRYLAHRLDREQLELVAIDRWNADNRPRSSVLQLWAPRRLCGLGGGDGRPAGLQLTLMGGL